MTNYAIADKIELLLSYAKMHLLLQDADECYIRNKLMDILRIDQPSFPTNDIADLESQILLPIADYAIIEGIIEESQIEHFITKLVDIVMPPPTMVIEHFDRVCSTEGMRAATSWLYEFGCLSNYIKLTAISKNIIWSFSGSRGDIIVTINLSKPEKDNKDVAAAKDLPQSKYPKCMLCPSNVGFSGKGSYPAKDNLRTIPIFLGEELWHFQFSPYSYYEHHCIALSNEHKPMVINNATFERMLEFVSLFPHYFIGSNAPLPIVGGSILTHDHYQGGGKVHPMFKRPVHKQYRHPDFAGVKVGIVDWYNSVIRLKSKNKDALILALNHIHDCWGNYSDNEVNILAKGDAQHNTITPIMRMERGEIFAEVILRNNRTDKEHPYGIYHPTEDMHHIKKEGIGVIEVMGTFILPGRLAAELHAIAPYLTGKKAFNEKELSCTDNPLYKHRFMIAELLINNGITDNEDKASDLITQYVNKTCEKILECTAVFKNSPEGISAFDKFLTSTGFVSAEQVAEVPPSYKVDEKLIEKETISETPKKRGRPKKVVE